jgi:hypothetical protein
MRPDQGNLAKANVPVAASPVWRVVTGAESHISITGRLRLIRCRPFLVVSAGSLQGSLWRAFPVDICQWESGNTIGSGVVRAAHLRDGIFNDCTTLVASRVQFRHPEYQPKWRLAANSIPPIDVVHMSFPAPGGGVEVQEDRGGRRLSESWFSDSIHAGR